MDEKVIKAEKDRIARALLIEISPQIEQGIVTGFQMLSQSMNKFYEEKSFNYRYLQNFIKEELKAQELESKEILQNLKTWDDKLVYANRRKELGRRKRIIKETYKAQLEYIALEEVGLDKHVV